MRASRATTSKRDVVVKSRADRQTPNALARPKIDTALVSTALALTAAHSTPPLSKMGKKGNSSSRGKHPARKRGIGRHDGHARSFKDTQTDGRPESAVDHVSGSDGEPGEEDDEDADRLVEIDVPVAMWVRTGIYRACAAL